MAIVNLQTGSSEWAGVNQTETVVLSTGGTGANVVMVAFGSGDQATTVTATVDGASMTKYAHYRHGYFGIGDGNCVVFGLTGSWTGDISVQVTHSMSTASRNYGTIHVYSMMAESGYPSFLDYGGSSGTNQSYSFSYDPDVGREAFSIWISQNHGSTPPQDSGSGVFHDTDSGNGAGLNFWHSGSVAGGHPLPESGTHANSKGPSLSNAVAHLTLVDATINAELTAMTLPITVTTPTVTGIDVVKAYFASLNIGLEVVPPGVVVKPRYVLRLVSEHGDMPGRLGIPSGLSQPVVGYLNGEPVWVELATHVHPTYRQRRVVMRPGITSPPEPVSNIDGDGFVYMELPD